MKRHLIAFLIIGLILTALGIPFSGLGRKHSHGYWFVWPYIAFAVTTAVAAAVGLVWPVRRRNALHVSMWSCICSPLLSAFAIRLWPGGDDGPGMAWIFFVIPASGFAGLWAAMVLIAGFGERDQ
jgi:hypothetical protein